LKYLQRYCLVLVIFVILLLCSTAYAADALYRFMHNDHDALIIGEITAINENDADVRVVEMIASTKNLDESRPRKQLKLSQVPVILPFDYMGFDDEDVSNKVNPSKGDYVLLSLNKVGRSFKIAWGAYKVNSLDHKNLSVVLPENPEVWSKMEAAAIKVFVNSAGQITEFAFDGNSKTVYAGEENVVIFSEDTDDNKDTHKDESQTKETSSTAVIGGADGPTSISVTEGPLKAMLIPAAVLAVIIFAGGFALGYIFKARR
jgi:hypothetical protein